MVKCGVLFEVRIGFLNIIPTSFGFKGLNLTRTSRVCFVSTYFHSCFVCVTRKWTDAFSIVNEAGNWHVLEHGRDKEAIRFIVLRVVCSYYSNISSWYRRTQNMDHTRYVSKSKAVPLHAMEGLGERGV
jgi:hypothetical protein